MTDLDLSFTLMRLKCSVNFFEMQNTTYSFNLVMQDKNNLIAKDEMAIPFSNYYHYLNQNWFSSK